MDQKKVVFLEEKTRLSGGDASCSNALMPLDTEGEIQRPVLEVAHTTFRKAMSP
jgi:hypothetical protein